MHQESFKGTKAVLIRSLSSCDYTLLHRPCKGTHSCNGPHSHFNRAETFKVHSILSFSTAIICDFSNVGGTKNSNKCSNRLKIKFPILPSQPLSIIMFMFHTLHVNRRISLWASGPCGQCLCKAKIGCNRTLSNWLLDGANWRTARAPSLVIR